MHQWPHLRSVFAVEYMQDMQRERMASEIKRLGLGLRGSPLTGVDFVVLAFQQQP